MWPNICRYGSNMTKSIADPMFKTMLPAPLNSLQFIKVDFGPTPFDLDNVVVDELTSTNGEKFVKFDVNVKWESESDVQLDGEMVPELGVKSVKLYGRMTVLLGPLIDVVPLVGVLRPTRWRQQLTLRDRLEPFNYPSSTLPTSTLTSPAQRMLPIWV